MQVEVCMQVQFYGMFYQNKRKIKKRRVRSIEYLRYGRDETLDRVSNFLFSGFLCAQKLSFLDHGRDIYALAWAGRQ